MLKFYLDTSNWKLVRSLTDTGSAIVPDLTVNDYLPISVYPLVATGNLVAPFTLIAIPEASCEVYVGTGTTAEAHTSLTWSTDHFHGALDLEDATAGRRTLLIRVNDRNEPSRISYVHRVITMQSAFVESGTSGESWSSFSSSSSSSSSSESSQSSPSSSSSSSPSSSSQSSSSSSSSLSSGSSSSSSTETLLALRNAPTLRAYWAMEEAGGNSRVDAVNSNDLTEVGTPVARATGMLNYCVSCVGTKSLTVVPDMQLDLGPSTAISCWMQYHGPDYSIIFGEGASPTDLYAKLGIVGNVLSFAVKESDLTLIAVSAGTPTSEEWHHVVGIAADGLVDIWLDGIMKQRVAYDGTIKNLWPNNVYVGREDGTMPPTRQIEIDEMAVWSAITFDSLSKRQAFVEDLYNGGTGLFFSGGVWS